MKLAASVLLAVPAVLLLLFAIGEMAGGELSGAQHIPEAALLLLLLVAGGAIRVQLASSYLASEPFYF